MYPPDLDPEALRLKPRPKAPTDKRRPSRLPRPVKGEAFFTGPIPMAWVERAAVLPGRAWHLACALWFVAVRDRNKDPRVTISLKTRLRFGLTRKVYYRAQNVLERAGLVKIQRRAGRKTEFTILPVSTGKGKQKKRKAS